MRPRLQVIVLILAIVLLLLLTIPQPPSPAALLDKEISATSVATLPKITNREGPPLKVKTYSALAQEVDGVKIFYELNSDRRWPLASLTKLMTAVVALEQVPVSASRDDFIQRLLIISDNEAAEDLAQTLGRPRFVAAMNSKAQELQMLQTSFFDASGLSFLNQSTVHDLYKLVNYIAARHPEILEWSRQLNIVIDNGPRQNINRFAGRPDYLGGKTGWTEEANGNLISVFATNNKPLTIIILGAPDRLERFAQTEQLLKWISQSFKP